MTAIKFSKVVSSLPATLTPDTLYFVRVGTGFDVYLTDMTGNIAHTLNVSGSSIPTILPPINPLTPDETYSQLDVTAFCRSLYDHTATNVELQVSDSIDFSTNVSTVTWPDNTRNVVTVSDLPIDYGSSKVYTRLRHTNVLGDVSDWSNVVGVYLIPGLAFPYIRLRVTQVFSSSSGYVVLSSMQIYDDAGTHVTNYNPVCGGGTGGCRVPQWALDDYTGYGYFSWGGCNATEGAYIGWDLTPNNPLPTVTKFRFWAASNYPLPEFAVDVSQDGNNWSEVIPTLGCGGYGGQNGQWWVYDITTGQVSYEA